jgi:RNA polymerase sigma-70 factor (ECF subfamily)
MIALALRPPVLWNRPSMRNPLSRRERAPDLDAPLLDGLRARDEAAFAELVDRYGPSMLRVARMHVRDRAVAEEVVQETWLAVLDGIDRFEGRSSLKTWLFTILTNRAKTRAVRERRTVPVSALAANEAGGSEPAVDPERFVDAAAERFASSWSAPPPTWSTLPEERLLSQETLARVAAAIEDLPEAQREVIRLRDVEGWSAAEVAAALEITDGNQRVLLHRARSKVRAALESYLEDGA